MTLESIDEIQIAVTALRLQGWQGEEGRPWGHWSWVTAIREYTSCLENADRILLALQPLAGPEFRAAFRERWLHRHGDSG